MNDETRKALDTLFSRDRNACIDFQPLGASRIWENMKDAGLEFRGRFEVSGNTLNLFRRLYDDAIAADDAAKLDAQREADAKAAKDKQATKDKQDKQDKGNE